jgi:hypothetical protein
MTAGIQVMSRRKLTKIRVEEKNPKAAIGMMLDVHVAKKAIPVVKVVVIIA